MTYKQFFSRLYYYLHPHLGKITITIVAVIGTSLLTSSLPEITGRIVDELFTQDSTSANNALFYSLILLGITVFNTLFTLIHTASNSWVSNQVIANIRQDMFAKILKLPQSYFDQNTTGKTLAKLTFNVEQISQAASTIWVDFARASVMVIALVSYLFYKNWQLSLMLVVLIPLIALSIYYSAIRMRKSSKAVQQSMGVMTHQLDENISGNALIKLYHVQTQESDKFYSLNTKIRQQRFKVDMSNAANASIASIGIGIALSLVVYFSSTTLKMSAGEFLAFFTAMAILVKPVKQLIGINKPLQLALVAAQSVFSLLDMADEPDVVKSNQQKQVLNTPQIEFSQVEFSYKKGQPVLSALNFSILAGKTIALVGSTGSGKSTITQLICRLYEPNSGQILLNGINISEFKLDEYRKNISLVDQSVRLFNGSIAYNIALGDKTITLDKIKQAARLACATEFINNLAQGFDAQIGENGIQLSGGQRQRLAIARAIAKQSAILIFDEATSALDNHTEQQLQQAIDAMHGKRTLIVIAHRLSTIAKADEIIVLEQGCIVEQGSHQALLAKQGAYYQLHKKQSV